MKKVLFAIFLALFFLTTLKSTINAQTNSLPYWNIRSVAYAFPGSTGDYQTPWTTLPANLQKIKAAGFNTVWLYMVWSKFEPQALPTPIYNDQNFENLKNTLALLKANNMKAILPMNYLWGRGNDGRSHPIGINDDSWLKDPVQYAAFESYMKEFLTRISEYSDTVYILLFTEGTNTIVSPYSPEAHAALLRPTLGSLPKRLPTELRSKFLIGYHDDSLIDKLSVPLSKSILPIEDPISFDFLSFNNYGTVQRNLNASQVINEMNQQVSRYKKYYPNTPLILGEFGASSCPQYGNEDTQAETDRLLINYAINNNFGFSLWGYSSLKSPNNCANGSADVGLGIYNNNGTPKKVVGVITKLLNSFTRGRAAYYLTEQFNMQTIIPNSPTFTDVPATSPFYQAVETFYKNKITTGCNVNPAKFCLNNTLTRAEAATYLLRIARYMPNITDSSPKFADVPQTHPLFKYVQLFAKLGITSGCSANPAKFCPDTAITKADLDIFISRIKERIVTGDFDADSHVNISDFNLIKENFGTFYNLTDYNNLITNYGK